MSAKTPAPIMTPVPIETAPVRVILPSAVPDSGLSPTPCLLLMSSPLPASPTRWPSAYLPSHAPGSTVGFGRCVYFEQPVDHTGTVGRVGRMAYTVRFDFWGKTMGTGRSVRARHVAMIGIVAAVVLLSGCELADWAPEGQYRPFYCDPTDVAINDGHEGGAMHMPHYTEEKGPLSATDCLQLNIHLNRAVDYASQFPTAGDAEANGWHHLAPFISGQGTHHVNIAQGVTSEFDPDRPNMLMLSLIHI